MQVKHLILGLSDGIAVNTNLAMRGQLPVFLFFSGTLVLNQLGELFLGLEGADTHVYHICQQLLKLLGGHLAGARLTHVRIHSLVKLRRCRRRRRSEVLYFFRLSSVGESVRSRGFVPFASLVSDGCFSRSLASYRSRCSLAAVTIRVAR